MDIEIEALLFSKPTSRNRREFKATLFAEKSLKQRRDVQIYGLLAHKVWLELESSRDVIDYSELPKAIQIPCGDRIVTHQFRFAVRNVNGLVQAIDIDGQTSSDTPLVTNDFDVKLEKHVAVDRWCSNQSIEYRVVTSDSYAGKEIWLSNLRTMLKFLESADGARDVVSEKRLELAIASLAPLPLRELLGQFQGCDQTILIAHVARGIFSGNFDAPIDRRRFDGSIVIDLAKNEGRHT